jgi:acyl-coenzyme A synthetase/AMP-(fatty) acid ligase
MNSWNTIHEDILLLVTNTPLPANISDLWMQGTTEWNQDAEYNTMESESPLYHFYTSGCPNYNQYL